MRIKIILFLFFLSLVPSQAQSDEATKKVLSNVLIEYIQPRYLDLHTSSQNLASETEHLCSTPSASNLGVVQSSFLSFTHSWAKIEWFRIGPVMSKNRIERILFYPDRKSTGLKQVQRALAQEDQTVTSVKSITQKSVAVQGLGALEFILFGSGSETLQTEEGFFRCAFAKAITQNMFEITRTLSDTWTPESATSNYWLNPSAENPLFRNNQEALNVLIGTMIHGLEAIRDVRIGAFLKELAKFDRPKSALMWRSENTTAMISNGLESLLELFNVSAIETLLPEENSSLGDSTRFEFHQAIRTLNSLQKPIAGILTSESDRKQMEYLKLSVGYAMSRLDNDISQQLGLSAGFSFGDGD